MPVSHAVKENPVMVVGSVFNEGDIVAGLDAEHGKQLQLVPGQDLRRDASREALWHVQLGGSMRTPLGVSVHLERVYTRMSHIFSCEIVDVFGHNNFCLKIFCARGPHTQLIY